MASRGYETLQISVSEVGSHNLRVRSQNTYDKLAPKKRTAPKKTDPKANAITNRQPSLPRLDLPTIADATSPTATAIQARAVIDAMYGLTLELTGT